MATMLSEVVHRHHLDRYAAAVYSRHDTAHNSPAAEAVDYRSPSDQYKAFSTASFRQRLERPQQHARPLRATLSSPSQVLSLASSGDERLPSEHMLRRKTPNGTLAAGYDGSPVEWNTRPHASKHLLLHASNAAADTCYSTMQLGDRPDPQQNYIHLDTMSQGGRYGQAGPVGPVESLKPDLGWGPTMMPAPGLDSVLNQSSLHNQQYRLAGDSHVPTVLQPMWPPCLGSTSIQDTGSFGPYWPNGVYEPYRPAPRRDPRFQPESAGSTLDHYSHATQADFSNQKRRRECDDAQCFSQKRGSSEMHVPGIINQSTVLSEGPLGISEGFQPAPEDHRGMFNQQYGAPLAYRHKEHPYKTQQQSPNLNRAYSNLRISNLEPSTKEQNVNQNTVGSQAQFKERVLMWAHRIYGSLLASIEQARRNAPSDQSSGPHRSVLYNPSPRRPYPSWSNRQIRQTGSDDGKCITLHKPSNGVRDSQFYTDTAPPSLARTGITTGVHGLHRLRASSSPKDSRVGLLNSSTNAAEASYVPLQIAQEQYPSNPPAAAIHAMEMLSRLCEESNWLWTDGMLLNGCLAYGLGDYSHAMKWYLKVLQCDPTNVEAMSNLAATLISLNRRQEAEQYWVRSVKLRPSYFEAVEHLVGLLHESHRGREAVRIVEYVEQALRIQPVTDRTRVSAHMQSPVPTLSGYAIPPSDNGRMLALIHGKGNVLYQTGDNNGAAKAFEAAILLGAGRPNMGIQGLIKTILNAFSEGRQLSTAGTQAPFCSDEPVLLPPEIALETSHLVFAPNGRLPGLEEVPTGMSQRAAVSIVSNSLLSLAKIYQDGMSSSGASATAPRATSGVQEILALYYLSLSLQPSPSTANNVGILLAGVQQSARARAIANVNQASNVPGVVPGSGVALALAYYDYGLKLDSRHAHLYTNLGSLFKDIGQLNAAIRMYEKAVECDGTFDIALANLANAVKDRGEVGEAIKYYRRAVTSNPDFAEAVCGLANALNSVCRWNGRGGVHHPQGHQDRWHVDENGLLYDSKKSLTADCGWIERVVAIVEKQLIDGQSWGKRILQSVGVENLMKQLGHAFEHHKDHRQASLVLHKALMAWSENNWEGAKVVRLFERATKRLGWQMYQDKHIDHRPPRNSLRMRPQLPAALAIPGAPTVLPFHTFTCPLSAKQIRKISQRNGLRVSCSTLRAPWLPQQIFEPPAPPSPHLNVGYVSSDFNNHPLAHLMQSVFGLHDCKRVKALCYATTASDGSVHRQQIEREAPVFHDASSWSIERLVNQIVTDGVHILVNLNGYTRGAKNEVFAARPAPIQMSFMGFAGTLGAEWCDYLLADQMAVPPQTLRPWRSNVDLVDQTQDGNNDDDQQDDWVYGENIIYTRDTFFCCDHRQSAPDAHGTQLSWPEEQKRRWKMRKELFPELADDTIILGNFNQLYKV